jgi:hypothetical protein
MRSLRMYSISPWSRPFELVARVSPDVEIRIAMLAVLFARYKALGLVHILRVEVGSNVRAERVCFCVCFEGSEGLEEGDGR